MNHLHSALLLLGLVASTSALAAGPAAARSEWREQRQELRIERGIAHGRIGPVEAAGLQRGQHRVDHLQGLARADGHVGVVERAHLQRVQDRQHRRIRAAVAY